jgi:muramoyltetrapeptide carboxypeptidase
VTAPRGETAPRDSDPLSTATAWLRPGDRVALVSPAGPSSPEAVSRACALLTSWELQPVLGAHVLDRHPTLSYLAGTDADRAGDLVTHWCDPAVSAVFCARGGYGSLRLLDLLDLPAMRAAGRKPLIGSSDITALHTFLERQIGARGLFAPMVATTDLLDDPAATAQLRAALFEPLAGRRLGAATAQTLVAGRAHGRLVGGNLSLLASTAPAPPADAVDNVGALALIEEIHDNPYRVDEMLTRLLRAGWFDGVAGIAFGSFTKCSDPEEVREFALETLAPLGVPMVWNLGFGHCSGAFSYPTAATATLVADGRPRLVLD